MRKTAGEIVVWIAVLTAAFQICIAQGLGQEKIVLDFEEPSEVKTLRRESMNTTLDIVQDYCVTSGKNCLRIAGRMGKQWASFALVDRAMLKDFEKYDYVGLDAVCERDGEIGLTLELFDKDSTDYYSRATLEQKKIHKGMNRLFWRINRARRNGKEGREWEELEPKDKIDRANLAKVKLFFTPVKDGGDTVLWIDKLRLLPENAVGGKIEIALPAGAAGFKFGSKSYCPGGFENIALEDAPAGKPRGARNCIGTGITEIGKDWPDPLTGNGLYCPRGGFTFNANVPAGEYRVWLSAGRILNRDTLDLPFELKVGDASLCGEKLTERDFFGEKGIFRYIRTQYSERPNALWLDYALPEAEEFTCRISLTNPPLQVRVVNMRLSAMVLAPDKDEEGFKKVCEDIRAARTRYFYERTYVKKQGKQAKPPAAGAYTMWMPVARETIRPWTVPAAGGSTADEVNWRGAQGERLAKRLCITAWEDLGTGDLEISGFRGPGTIPATAVRKYYMNYRFQDGSVDEMALFPWTRIRFEPGITWTYWLWLKVPDDAVAGAYTATVTFKPDKGGEKKIAVKLTVLPFKLDDNLPVAYGMYYNAWNFSPRQLPEGFTTPAEFVLSLTKEHFRFMREIGFTTTSLPAPNVFEWKLRAEHAEPYWKAAREAGMGRNPDQKLMTSQLNIARRIARDMFHDMDAGKYGYEHVDRNPGVEFTLPEFPGRLAATLAKFKQWTDKMELPVAMEVVDEPREVPNPWNRRRDETIRYADWVREAGFIGFVTFIADENEGKDYMPIADHVDIVSVHAWEQSKGLISKARKLKKTLWFYNTGMDRLSWGFYNWAMESKGRWEWHFCAPDPGGVDGHPNTIEWYTPFTSLVGAANQAPYFDFPGGMTFKSVFFNVAEGITDYAYIHTLEKAIEAEAGSKNKAAVVSEARAFLASVKKAIPEYPGIANMTGADAGALVGAGLDTPVAQMTEIWRARIADLLTQLKNE